MSKKMANTWWKEETTILIAFRIDEVPQHNKQNDKLQNSTVNSTQIDSTEIDEMNKLKKNIKRR